MRAIPLTACPISFVLAFISSIEAAVCCIPADNSSVMAEISEMLPSSANTFFSVLYTAPEILCELLIMS
ncbi:hypothetical protein D3C75_1256980 [compost metagenome]